MILQSTPVLFVESIDPSQAFFEKLGFSVTVMVPEGEGTDFVIMMQGGSGDNGLGIMLQTKDSAAEDMSMIDEAIFSRSSSFLFMSVADVDAAAKTLAGYERFMEPRQTFYGASEVGFREPGGHFVVLAEFATESDDAA